MNNLLKEEKSPPTHVSSEPMAKLIHEITSKKKKNSVDELSTRTLEYQINEKVDTLFFLIYFNKEVD